MSSICSNDSFVTLLSVVGAFLRLLIIVVVVVAIIVSMIDFFKAMSSNESNYNPFKLFSKRLVALLILFFIPSFVRLVINVVEVDTSESCVETVFTVLFNAKTIDNSSLTCEGGTLVVAKDEELSILKENDSLVIKDGTNFYCLGGYFE